MPLILTNEMVGFNVTPNKILSGSAVGSIKKHSDFNFADINPLVRRSVLIKDSIGHTDIIKDIV